MSEEFQYVELLTFEKKPKKYKKQTDKPKVEAEAKKYAQVIDHEKRYFFLLKRVSYTLSKNNPDLAEKSKIILKPPQVNRPTSKKTTISNFTYLCKQLDRHPEHVMNYFIRELGREGSMGNSGFTIKTVIQQKHVYSLFRNYIFEYVQCSLCKRQNTDLIKDYKMRLWSLQCKNCKCTRTVMTIKGAYKKYEDWYRDQYEARKKKEYDEHEQINKRYGWTSEETN